jgi:hypothetical protein
MKNQNQAGQIVAFYSFKGGVGRTMALANLAFLTALNGLRVLVMDWDLEAPGLAYYFRGLRDAPEAKDLKDAPGLLNLLWEWRGMALEDKPEAECKRLLHRFESGEAFQQCARSLLQEADPVPPGAVLDLIGPGSPSIPTPEPTRYETALADFSWPSFFDEQGGGHFLAYLRDWAKSHYDIVLVDSRTGLADAAGVCTMQIPDTVALCFVLNRQNIDGIAKVAAAIRANRGDAIALRAVPMRVARQDTSEESDARARAISELTRIGGFASEAAQKDFQTLQIPAADNVPFYETLAPFYPWNQNPKLDPLTLNYLNLANELLGKQLSIPSFDPAWIERIRRRLRPSRATVDYLGKLCSGEPARIIEELPRLIESAIDAEVDGDGFEDSYIVALVEAALGFNASSDYPMEAMSLQGQAQDLLRILVLQAPEKWKALLSTAIERYLDLGRRVGLDAPLEELALLEELDGLLAQFPTIYAIQLKRIRHRRRAAEIFVEQKNTQAAMQALGMIQKLVKEIRREGVSLGYDQANEVLAAEGDFFRLSGDVARFKGNKGNNEQASKFYQKGLDLFKPIESATTNPELNQIRFELHSRLAAMQPPSVPELSAAEHAIQAVKLVSSSYLILFRFTELARPVLKLPNHSELALAFCESALGELEGRSQTPLAYYFVGTQYSIEILETITALAKIIATLGDERALAAFGRLAETFRLVLQSLSRRRQTIGQKGREELSVKIAEFAAILENAGLSPEKLAALNQEREVLMSPPRKSSSTPVKR